MVIFSSEAFRVLLMTFLKHKTGITDKLTKILYSRPNSHAGVVFFNVYFFDWLFAREVPCLTVLLATFQVEGQQILLYKTSYLNDSFLMSAPCVQYKRRK